MIGKLIKATINNLFKDLCFEVIAILSWSFLIPEKRKNKQFFFVLKKIFTSLCNFETTKVHRKNTFMFFYVFVYFNDQSLIERHIHLHYF
jgi:hypothetical protein